MKVLMINSVAGFGSTGSICVDIANELARQGSEGFIAYGQINRGFKNVFKIGTVIENHLHNLGSRILGNQGYYTRSGTKKLVKFIEKYNPDVIHLHNLHGNYLNLEILFEYLIKVQKPIVWTLHDCWAFTGKCTYFTDVACGKWQSECHKCPQIHKYPPSIYFDRSRMMFKDKKKWFTALKNVTILPVSHWLASEVEKSFLNKYNIQPIYNWINHDIFKPSEQNDVAASYNLDANKFTILCVSAFWNKNDVRFQDLLKLAQTVGDHYQIVVVGKMEAPKLLPSNCSYFSYINGKDELAKLYNFADVYVHLSTEDTFGLVIAEAMSCGTPVIVYDVTACPEIVGEGCGYKVEKRNIAEIVNRIKLVEKDGKNFYSMNCRQHVLKNFDISTNINDILNVYKNALRS